MSENSHTTVTKRLFQKHLLREDETNAYLSQVEMSRKFNATVDECVKKMGELFISEVEIITEPFSPLARIMVERIAKKYGLIAHCENHHRALKYLGSDGGGHYSTDYYHYLEYGCIRVTLAQK